MSFRKRYVAFLAELEKIAKAHDELSDTDVRERLHEVVNFYFVWNKTTKSPFPKRFAMFSAKADQLVHKAVRAFIADAIALAEKEGLAPGAARHAALEDRAAKTKRGNSYDVFLGSADKVLPPKKPAPDKLYERETAKRASGGAAPLDLSLLTIKVAGQKITPGYDPEFGMYEYRLANGDMAGVKGDTVEAVVELATRFVVEMIEDRKKDARSVRKPVRSKPRAATKPRKVARRKT